MKIYYKNLLNNGIINREKYFELISNLKVKEEIDKLLKKIKVKKGKVL